MAVVDASGDLTATIIKTTESAGRPLSELQIPKKPWRDRGKSATSPERTRVWSEPSPKPKRVPVVYYLSSNGQLEHPHFMEVPLSSPDGLYLRDVISRLNLLRGTGMAALYSWSSKRSYKNGFVWQDLAETDFIYPSHGTEYVLKGSELLHDALRPPLPLSTSSFSSGGSRPLESVSFRSPKLAEAHCKESNFPVAIPRRRNQSWSSIDLKEYKVYKTELAGELVRRPGADASTQTDDRRRRARRQAKLEQEAACREPEKKDSETTELTRDEISPPPSDSSPETLETLLKADGRLVLSSSTNNNAAEEKLEHAAETLPSGRMKASTVLMQLITCGSFSFRDCGATYVKDRGMSLISHYKPGLPRRARNNPDPSTSSTTSSAPSGELWSLSSGLKLEDKEYFSGSLIETSSKKPDLVAALKRSSSYNADRSSQVQQLGESDIDGGDGVRARCIPRKLRNPTQQTNVRE